MEAIEKDRALVRDALRRWQANQLDAPGLKEELRKAFEGRDLAADPTLREALFDLDLLEVYLLTVEDVPQLLAFLDEPDADRGLSKWRAHREAIDLDARSKALKKNRFYRPFCR